MIENAPSDLLGPPVDNLENNVNDESDQDCKDLNNIENEDSVCPNWIVLLEMRSDAEIEISSDLNFCDINWSYNWSADLRTCYPDLDLAVIPNFIQQA